MDKLIERGLLFDFYGELLTPHQQKIYSDAVFNDLSLQELSDEEGISRQGIHDLIKRCDKQLLMYEDKLHLIEKFKSIKTDINAVELMINNDPSVNGALKQEVSLKFKEIIKEL